MARDLATFRLLFPEMTVEIASDETVNFWIERAIERLNENAWGRGFDDAVLYWSAHKIALARARAAPSATSGASGAGVLSSATVDGTSASFAVPEHAVSGTKEEMELARTAYGQEYLALMDTYVSAVYVGRC